MTLIVAAVIEIILAMFALIVIVTIGAIQLLIYFLSANNEQRRNKNRSR